MKNIEVGSFVSPKWVPQMAGTGEVLASLPHAADVAYPVLVPNLKGLDEALRADASFVFNGSVGALSKLHPLQAKVGETVRIFFGVGGPNYTSSFHVIGEIFDRVYNLGSLLSEPLRGVQTCHRSSRWSSYH